MRRRQPNILWIQTDEQRADSIGAFGAPWAKTPALDGLAARGVTFTNCYCQSPVCVPSRASQLAGVYPQACSTLYNTVEDLDNIFPPHTVTFPEALVEWFSQARYDACSAFDRAIADAQDGCTHPRDEFAQMWTDYMGLCAYVDHEIGRLLTALHDAGLAGDTVVMFSSDHGKSLGEWGAWEKGTFHDAAWRVPMIWSWPDHLPEGEKRTDLSALIDTGRTMLSLADLGDQIPDHWCGRDLFNDPEPDAVFGQIGWPDAEAPLLARPDVHPRVEWLTDQRMTLRVGMRTRTHHLDLSWMRDGALLSRAEQDGNLFDIAADPDEINNLWHTDNALVSDMVNRVQQWSQSLDTPEALCRKRRHV